MTVAHRCRRQHGHLALTDPTGRITRVNKAFERMSGFSVDEVVGSELSVLEGDAEASPVAAALQAALNAGQAWSGRLRIRRKGGAVKPRLPVFGRPEKPPADLFWVEASVTPLLRPDGELEGFVAMQRDVTEQVALEEQERLRLEGVEARLGVAKALGGTGDFRERLKAALDQTLGMRGLGIQRKGGLLLIAPGERVLRLEVYSGDFSEPFLRDDAQVLVGQCLCGRAAASGEILVSDDCFTDHRHENRWEGMTPHGHYIVTLMNRVSAETSCIGVMLSNAAHRGVPGRARGSLFGANARVILGVDVDRDLELAEVSLNQRLHVGPLESAHPRREAR